MSTLPKLIEPRTLKGFRDYLPAAMMAREWLIDVARRVYRSYGFAPIDTPALEYLEILTGKGSDETDKQLYKFEDAGGRQVGLRFDLTVPLARFVAQHANDLGMPFKRYHIASVWRGENTQRGRYREFMQCDFDTIGTTSVAADIETVLVVQDLFRALDVGGFTLHVNNRQVLTGILEKLDLAEKSTAVLRALDKLAKIGRDKVAAELMETAAARPEQIQAVLELAELRGDNHDVLARLDKLASGNERASSGVARLRELTDAVAKASGPGPGKLTIDASIARGLDYYTGVILETFLDRLPAIGSVCSGGRYDNLAGLYTKQQLPGIGASLGLDRLLAALEELELAPKTSTPAAVFVPYFDAERLSDYLKLAALVRSFGFGCEVFPEAKKLGQQLKYADRRGHRVALIAGADELASGTCQVKDLKTGDSVGLSLADNGLALAERLAHLLS